MRIVGHLDMDAFFASVEERNRPWLKGKPIVVGADPMEGRGRGVVSTANYEARKFGIHSAMPISKAWQLAQEAHKKGASKTAFLRGGFGSYGKVSAQIMDILSRYSPTIEVASVDEAYFDLSHAGSFKKAEQIARRIKKEIYKTHQLTASIGVGPNKLIAKIASGTQKPNGLTVIEEKDAGKFLESFSIREIPGIGPKAEEALAKRKIRTVKEARRLSEEELQWMFGVRGRRLYEKLRGQDETPLEVERQVKSIGEQETFMEDTLKSEVIFKALEEMSKRIAVEVKKEEFSGFRTVTAIVRFADFTTKTRAHTSKKIFATSKELFIESVRLVTPFLDRRENPKKKPIRLVGVRVSKLDK